MQTFRSKIDLWLIVLILSVCLLPSILIWGEGTALIIILSINLPFFVMVGWLCWATKYVVQNNILTVYTGFGKIKIPLDSITSLTPSRSLLASPAMSLDRFEVIYDQNKIVLISPKDKIGFLSAIGKK